MNPAIYIVLVTHNSELELLICLDFLNKQKRKPDSVHIVDSGSQSTQYLENLITHFPITITKTTNVGFAAANNVGLKELEPGSDDLILFINPDTFLPEDFLLNLPQYFSEDEDVGAVGPKLLGFDPQKNRPTGVLDSTGVFRRWYGRWVDRGYGEKETDRYSKEQTMPALCGALFCCRAAALTSLKSPGFDEDFFLYKEDIELSLRLRKKGWKLLYVPDLFAYHCRGWNQAKRNEINYRLKLMSAENEILLYKKHPSFYILWAVLKYFLVRFCRV